VRPQHGGKLEIIGRAFAALQDSDDLKSVSVVLFQETLRAVEICGDAVRMRVIAGEHEELEASIGRSKILYVYLTCVSGAHKYVREKALANYEV
jgi:hypothetical protein